MMSAGNIENVEELNIVRSPSFFHVQYGVLNEDDCQTF